MAERRQRLSGRAWFGAAAGLLAILLVAGIYVTHGGEGNGADAVCAASASAARALHPLVGGADFSVVPVSIDIGDRTRPAEFLKSIGVTNLPLNTDRSTEIFESLKKRGLALGLPVTVLLDRHGCTLGHMNGPAEWDSEDGRRLIEAAIGSRHADEAGVDSGSFLAALDAVPSVDLGAVEGRVGRLE